MIVAVLGNFFLGDCELQCEAPQKSSSQHTPFRVEHQDSCIRRATLGRTIFHGVFQHRKLIWDDDFRNSRFHIDEGCIAWNAQVAWLRVHRELRGEHNASFLISAQDDNSRKIFCWRSRKYHGDDNRQAMSARSSAACRDCAVFHCTISEKLSSREYLNSRGISCG